MRFLMAALALLAVACGSERTASAGNTTSVDTGRYSELFVPYERRVDRDCIGWINHGQLELTSAGWTTTDSIQVRCQSGSVRDTVIQESGNTRWTADTVHMMHHRDGTIVEWDRGVRRADSLSTGGKDLDMPPRIYVRQMTSMMP